jgi:hypothetical protein
VLVSKKPSSVDVGLLGCNAVWPPSSGMKMEAACSSEIMISTCKYSRRYKPADIDIFTALRTSNFNLLLSRPYTVGYFSGNV